MLSTPHTSCLCYTVLQSSIPCTHLQVIAWSGAGLDTYSGFLANGSRAYMTGLPDELPETITPPVPILFGRQVAADNTSMTPVGNSTWTPQVKVAVAANTFAVPYKRFIKSSLQSCVCLRESLWFGVRHSQAHTCMERTAVTPYADKHTASLSMHCVAAHDHPLAHAQAHLLQACSAINIKCR